jgi:hypothetical protein
MRDLGSFVKQHTCHFEEPRTSIINRLGILISSQKFYHYLEQILFFMAKVLLFKRDLRMSLICVKGLDFF